MKVEYTKRVTVEADVTHLAISIPEDEVCNGDCYEGDGRLPESFKVKDGDYTIYIDVETGKIANWPEGLVVDAYFKPRDGGSYALLDKTREVICAAINEYVPSCCGWGEGGGDYLELKVSGDGSVAGFSTAFIDQNLSEFLEYCDGEC